MVVSEVASSIARFKESIEEVCCSVSIKDFSDFMCSSLITSTNNFTDKRIMGELENE